MTHAIILAATGVLAGWGMRGWYEMFHKSESTSNREKDQ